MHGSYNKIKILSRGRSFRKKDLFFSFAVSGFFFCCLSQMWFYMYVNKVIFHRFCFALKCNFFPEGSADAPASGLVITVSWLTGIITQNCQIKNKCLIQASRRVSSRRRCVSEEIIQLILNNSEDIEMVCGFLMWLPGSLWFLGIDHCIYAAAISITQQ